MDSYPQCFYAVVYRWWEFKIVFSNHPSEPHSENIWTSASFVGRGSWPASFKCQTCCISHASLRRLNFWWTGSFLCQSPSVWSARAPSERKGLQHLSTASCGVRHQDAGLAPSHSSICHNNRPLSLSVIFLTTANLFNPSWDVSGSKVEVCTSLCLPLPRFFCVCIFVTSKRFRPLNTWKY